MMQCVMYLCNLAREGPGWAEAWGAKDESKPNSEEV